MPSFFTDAIENLWTLWFSIVTQWHALSAPTRIVAAVGMASLAIYGASRSETSGMSMILFFCAFAFFAYVVTVGYGIMQ